MRDTPTNSECSDYGMCNVGHSMLLARSVSNILLTCQPTGHVLLTAAICLSDPFLSGSHFFRFMESGMAPTVVH